VQCPGCGKEVSIDDIEESYAPDITENYIRLRQKDPNDFEKDTFRTIILSKSRGIHAIIGRLKGKATTTIQSYLFEKNKWNVKDAQTWVKKHQGSIDNGNENAILSLDEDSSEEEFLVSVQEFEQAPYRTNNELPANVKKLPSGAQSIWRKVFNDSYPKGEDYAFRVAWSAVKRVYFKNPSGNWVRKSIGELEESFKELEVGDLIDLQKLDILGKQSSLLNTLIKNNDSTKNE
jgi:cation transport regulator